MAANIRNVILMDVNPGHRSTSNFGKRPFSYTLYNTIPSEYNDFFGNRICDHQHTSNYIYAVKYTEKNGTVGAYKTSLRISKKNFKNLFSNLEKIIYKNTIKTENDVKKSIERHKTFMDIFFNKEFFKKHLGKNMDSPIIITVNETPEIQRKYFISKNEKDEIFVENSFYKKSHSGGAVSLMTPDEYTASLYQTYELSLNSGVRSVEKNFMRVFNNGEYLDKKLMSSKFFIFNRSSSEKYELEYTPENCGYFSNEEIDIFTSETDMFIHEIKNIKLRETFANLCNEMFCNFFKRCLGIILNDENCFNKNYGLSENDKFVSRNLFKISADSSNSGSTLTGTDPHTILTTYSFEDLLNMPIYITINNRLYSLIFNDGSSSRYYSNSFWTVGFKKIQFIKELKSNESLSEYRGIIMDISNENFCTMYNNTSGTFNKMVSGNLLDCFEKTFESADKNSDIVDNYATIILFE